MLMTVNLVKDNFKNSIDLNSGISTITSCSSHKNFKTATLIIALKSYKSRDVQENRKILVMALQVLP